MNPFVISGRRIPLIAALCVATALPMLGACNMESVPQALVIRANRVPDTGCVVNASAAGGKVRTKGKLDLSIGRAYTAYLLVENRFRALSDLTQFEDGDARLDGATVSFQQLEVIHHLPDAVLSDAGFQAATTAAGATNPPNPIIIPVGGFAAPDETTITAADIVPGALGQALRGFSGFVAGQEVEMQVELRLTGVRGDGSIVESAPFYYPILLCNNCLVRADTAETIVVAPTAQDIADADIYGYGEVCTVGADVPVSNFWCASYGPGQATADDCKLQRCLGRASTSLSCQSDGTELAAPVLP